MDRIRKSITRLVYYFPFFGFIALRLHVVEEPDPAKCPTASISRTGVLRVNPAFLESLTDAQVLGLLCHEILHAALLCWDRQGNRLAILYTSDGHYISAWNAAHDYAINIILQDVITSLQSHYKKEHIAAIPGWLYDVKYTGWSAEHIYDDIITNTPTISMFMADIVEDEADGRAMWEDILKQAASHHGRGRLLASLTKAILDPLQSKSSWADILAQWVGDNIGMSNYSYRRPSRKTESSGEILAILDYRTAPEIIILWDTSGSMSGSEERVLGEINAIVEPFRTAVRIIMCDSQVQADVTSVRDVLEVASSIVGGGGSDFTPAFDLIDSDPRSIVIAVTDGHIGVPQKHPPVQAVIWVLTEQGVDPTRGSWGSVIHMDDR